MLKRLVWVWPETFPSLGQDKSHLLHLEKKEDGKREETINQLWGTTNHSRQQWRQHVLTVLWGDTTLGETWDAINACLLGVPLTRHWKFWQPAAWAGIYFWCWMRDEEQVVKLTYGETTDSWSRRKGVCQWREAKRERLLKMRKRSLQLLSE